MKKIVVLLFVLMSNVASACGLVVSNAQAKASMPGTDNSAGYLDIKNTTGKDMVITGVSSDVAKATELHTMSMSGDTMSMRQIKKITVPAGQTFEMQGKYHVMFIGLKKPLAPGDFVKIKFTVDGQSSHEIELPVVMGNEKAKHHHEKHEHHEHHDEKDEHHHHH